MAATAPQLPFRVAAIQDGSYDLSAPPPFGLADIRNAIPSHCWEKNTGRSMAYLARDVGVVAALAFGAYTLNAWWVSHTCYPRRHTSAGGAATKLV